MSKVDVFEDLRAWKDSRKLVKSVYELSSSGELAREYVLKNQMRRAVVSIMANIAEGFERGGNREFLQFLAIAKGSAGELRSHLYAAYDLDFLQSDEFKSLSESTLSVSRQVSGLMKYLKSSSLKGSKYK